MKKSYFLKISCLLMMLIFLLTGCSFFEKPNDETPPPETETAFKFKEEDFLKAQNYNMVNGLNKTITLKGTNAGGYLLIEEWMTAIKGSETTGYLDHKTTTEIFTERFGKERTIKLWDWYRKSFWTEQDFKNCADMGMNVIRLPFSYMNVDPLYNNVAAIEGQKYNFSLLEDFVNMAEKYGIYTILDLHGAYGSQNGQDHSGESLGSFDEVDFYSNTEKQNKTIELWAAVAKHFNGNPAVAAYDILNEPGEKAAITTTRHFEFFDKVYDAIRKVDPNHVIIFESCWDGAHFPKPEEYGWTNCMYSVHNYTGKDDHDENLGLMKYKIDGMTQMNFNVPNYMGEFNCYSNEESWRDTLKLFNDSGWSWTSWTYKINSIYPGAYAGWGIYYTRAQPVTPDVDSYNTIIEKWGGIRTGLKSTETYKFSSGKTMVDILTEACNEKS